MYKFFGAFREINIGAPKIWNNFGAINNQYFKYCNIILLIVRSIVIYLRGGSDMISVTRRAITIHRKRDSRKHKKKHIQAVKITFSYYWRNPAEQKFIGSYQDLDIETFPPKTASRSHLFCL